MHFFLRRCLLFCLPILLITCSEKEPTPRKYSRVRTLPVTNITDQGVTFSGEVFYQSDEAVTDHGFIWSTGTFSSIQTSTRRSLGPKSGKGAFSAQISSTLAEGITYYVKAYVVSKNYTVYGQPVAFESQGSQAPVIQSFSPASATFGDTITLTGLNFSTYSFDNALRFGDIAGYIASSSETTMKVVVPDYLRQASSPLVLTLARKTATSPTEFKLLPPRITTITPAAGTFGTVVEITGNNFCPFAAYNTVKFGDQTATVRSATLTRLEVEVPTGVPGGPVSVTVSVAGQATVSPVAFTVQLR
jgi:hypothetical protein